MPDNVLTTNLLGLPHLSWQDIRVEPRSKKVRALIYYLATCQAPSSRTTLAELLWGPGRYHNLRQALHAVRKLPGAEHWLADDGLIIIRAACDVKHFEQSVVRNDYSAALSLWKGDLLSGFRLSGSPAFNEWLEIERRRLEDLLRHVLQQRAEELTKVGQATAALEHLHRLIEIDPLDESAHRSVMRLEFTRGHLQAALAQFEWCRRVLLEDLGTEPLAETWELARLIESGNLETLPNATVFRMPPQLLRPPKLLDREHEWAKLENAWQQGKAIFITGPAGIGKTRLMLDFARSKGLYLLNEGRPTDATLPFSSLAHGLRLIRSAFPDFSFEPGVEKVLSLIAPDVFPNLLPAQKQRLTKALLINAWYWTMKTLKEKVDVLPADDLHYFDPASAEVAESVSVRLAQDYGDWRHIGAYREDEMPLPVIQAIQQGADAGRNEIVRLRPLQPDATKTLLNDLEVPGDETFIDNLHRYTGGNPTFIIEVVKDLYIRGKLEPRVARFEVPTRISAIIERRLTTLEPQQLRLLRATAVLQPYTRHDLLAQILDLSVFDIAEGIGELEKKQFLQEGRFIHDLLYETVLALTPIAVLTLLHYRSARILEDASEESLHIAHHFAEAKAFARAVPHWLEAARRYREAGLQENALVPLEQVISHTTETKVKREALLELAWVRIELGHFGKALALLDKLPTAELNPSMQARTLEIRALIHLGQGQLVRAEKAVDKGLRLASQLKNSALSQRLRFTKARAYYRAGRYSSALNLLTPLLADLARSGSSHLRISVQSELAAILSDNGRFEEALALHYEALDLAYEVEVPHLRIMVANHLVYSLLEVDRAEEAVEIGETALELGDSQSSDLLRSTVGRAHIQINRLEQATAHFEYLAHHTGDAAILTLAWAYLAEVYNLQEKSAMEALNNAVTMVRETDFVRVQARVVISVLRYGNPAHKREIQSLMDALELQRLPTYLQKDLRPLLTF